LSKYKIFETDQFTDDLRENIKSHYDKVVKKLKDFIYTQLKQNPYYGKNIKKLRNYTPETWRYKIVEYRLFYEIDEENKTIFMITADMRKDIYRR
jgi:mRNA interferase RelE/StbE